MCKEHHFDADDDKTDHPNRELGDAVQSGALKKVAAKAERSVTSAVKSGSDGCLQTIDETAGSFEHEARMYFVKFHIKFWLPIPYFALLKEIR